MWNTRRYFIFRLIDSIKSLAWTWELNQQSNLIFHHKTKNIFGIFPLYTTDTQVIMMISTSDTPCVTHEIPKTNDEWIIPARRMAQQLAFWNNSPFR